jgi:quercetin dioxygenase-like cupin family protein
MTNAGIVLRDAGDGEAVTARSDRSVVIVLDLEQLCATTSWYATAQPGAAPHVHRRHVDTFFIVSGELTFTTGDELMNAAAGTTVCAAPGVVHGFDSTGEARFLNFHTPNRDFGESLRVRRDGRPYDPSNFDSFDPPADRSAGGHVFVAGSCQGERFTGAGWQALVKVDRDELAAVEFTLEPGFAGPLPHIHDEHVDSFFVLDGEVGFRVGSERVRLGPGACVAAPPGTVHSFGEPGPRGARLLNIHAPSCNFSDYLRALVQSDGELDPATHATYDVREVD